MAYISRYPTLDLYHVGATSMWPVDYNATTIKSYYPYFAFDPSKPLTGTSLDNCWLSLSLNRKYQRIWANLNTPYVITRLYYENYHSEGRDTRNGAYLGSIWGSNIQPEAYGTYERLTNLWTATTSNCFLQHTPNDVADPQYITFINTSPFQYYIIDIDVNYSGLSAIGFRRIEWQENI